MKKIKLIFAWAFIILSVVSASGCTSNQVNSVIGTAISAGIAYGISRAVKK